MWYNKFLDFSTMIFSYMCDLLFNLYNANDHWFVYDKLDISEMNMVEPYRMIK